MTMLNEVTPLLAPPPKLGATGQETARKAAEIVAKRDKSFVVPDAAQRRALRMAFAARDHVLYGKAFDIVRIEPGERFDLASIEEIERHWRRITIYEIKSTGKEKVCCQFTRYFFSISTAELLTAQDLREKYRFLFVNTTTGDQMDLSLREVFARAKGIYPTWSIQF
jgi:hypothetical protein